MFSPIPSLSLRHIAKSNRTSLSSPGSYSISLFLKAPALSRGAWDYSNSSASSNSSFVPIYTMLLVPACPRHQAGRHPFLGGICLLKASTTAALSVYGVGLKWLLGHGSEAPAGLRKATPEGMTDDRRCCWRWSWVLGQLPSGAEWMSIRCLHLHQRNGDTYAHSIHGLSRAECPPLHQPASAQLLIRGVNNRVAGSAQSRQFTVKVGECWALCTEKDFKLPTEQLPHSVLVFTIHLKGHLFFHSVFITFHNF